jgi:hypothetical protein
MSIQTTQRIARAALAMILALSIGCPFAPYAPRDPNAMSPEGESVPVPDADPNPLETPRSVSVVCSPQGTPTVKTDEVLECETDPDCRIDCDRDSTRDADPEPPFRNTE